MPSTTKKNTRVLVAMSGGVDSTATALLLKAQGYEVIGVTMKTWDYAIAGSCDKETGCCTLDSIIDARSVAVREGFPHYIFDIREEFGDYVIEDFVSEYLAGRTPNPCILCNTHIKWEALLRRADLLGCDYIATGHYAIKAQEGGRYFIRKSADRRKDQSYVLWGLSQEALARTLFPLGHLTKDKVRSLLKEYGYDTLSKKGESYEICFIPDNDYRAFLKHRVPDLEQRVEGGYFVDTKGNVLGRHRGYPFYTIGQRRGLGIALGKPMYVVDIDPSTNTVVLGTVEELIHNAMTVYKTHLQKYDHWPEGKVLTVKVRYQDPGTPAVVFPRDDDTLEVAFLKGVRSITPGQSAVFYEGDDLVGGGIIYRFYDVQNPAEIASARREWEALHHTKSEAK